ncbi:MAG: hypothetical protein HYY24_22810 [Verrucomicrobia bacterium]|nr:hypothetical protein [Verrucomicrobiota bacterium]
MLQEASGELVAKAEAEPAPRVGGRSLAERTKTWRGLLWAEWFAHSKLLLLFLGVWLVGVWTLPLFTHPGWILLLGAAYALAAGPAYGGGDVLHGCEEFSFALPATRTERYLARLAVGLGTLLFLTTINLLALGLDLPYVLGRLYIKTGLVRPEPMLKTGLLSSLVAALPVAVFCFGFALSAITHSRGLILTAWFWAALAALAVLQLGFWYEDFVWDSLTGFFSFPLLLLAGAGGLWIGGRLYMRKEVAEAAAPLTLPARWWLWLLVFVVGLALALALFSSLAKHYPKFLAPTG